METERLRYLVIQGGTQHAARLLRRSVEAVGRKMVELFSGLRRRGQWDEGDIDLLRRGFGVLTRRELGLMLRRTQRDVDATVARLRRELREGDWTENETALFNRLYGSRSDRDLVVCLSRSLEGIRAMARRLALGKNKGARGRTSEQSRMPRWTTEDEDRLRFLYPDGSNASIALTLGRTVKSVTNKARQLGLHKTRAFSSVQATKNVSRRRDRQGG